MHFETLLFILLIAMAALLRLLATKAGEAKKRPQKSDQGSRTTPQVSKPIKRAPVESDAIDTEPKTKGARTGTDIATLLRSAAGLRNAIILREIFGPPRSLQSLDLVGSA